MALESVVPAITRNGDMAGNPFSGVQIVTEGFVLFKLQGAAAATAEINSTEAKVKKSCERRKFRGVNTAFPQGIGFALRQMV